MKCEQIKNWLGNNWFKIVIIVILLLVGFSLFYYFFLSQYQYDMPYRECMKQIDPNANFGDIRSEYHYCIEFFR
jgi:predicted negative regulator of RcsB-dependent stress response